MKNLKRVRKAKRVTQEMLSSLTGINRAILSLYETGHRSPTVLTAAKIAKALDCTIDDLVVIE